MSKFYILANLKMNKSFDQSVKYLESLSKKVTNYDDEIILFPSNISLEYFSRNIGKFKLGIQDLDYRNEGQEQVQLLLLKLRIYVIILW